LAGEWFSYPFRQRKIKPGSREKMQLKLQTKEVALIAIYAALYAVLVVEIPGLSYGPLNLRVADAMIGAVPLLGIAGVLGHALGVFVGNIPSPFGFIDLLNTIPSFVMAFVVYYAYKRTRNDYSVLATSVAYSAVLGTTVGWMLSAPFNIPLPLSILYVFIGNLIMTTVVGWPLFKLLKRTGVFERWFGNGETVSAASRN
jgi:uncharacterized membrane protein